MSTVERNTKDALAAAQERIRKAAEDEELDQRRAPLLEALRAYHECEPASFSIPAHKGGASLDELTREVLGEGPYRADAPAHKGLDDRVSSNKVQSFAQELAADAFGAEQALFSTNGSTLSVQIAVLAATHPGQKVAVARNVHKSVISGLILSGAHPVFVDPVYDDEHALAHAVQPEALAAALDAHPDIKAMLAVSPTVAGVAADVSGLADVCHAHGIPLIRDDAWGADFTFHPELPPGSMESGADLAVASFHKSLTGLMQTSIILVEGADRHGAPATGARRVRDDEHVGAAGGFDGCRAARDGRPRAGAAGADARAEPAGRRGDRRAARHPSRRAGARRSPRRRRPR